MMVLLPEDGRKACGTAQGHLSGAHADKNNHLVLFLATEFPECMRDVSSQLLMFTASQFSHF